MFPRYAARVVCAVIVGFSLELSAHAQSLAEAVDQDAMSWSTTGAANWIGQTTYTHDGIDAAESGLVFGNQSSVLQTAVTGPVGVGFWWSARLRSAYDFLSFNIDSTQIAILRGEPGWYRRGFNIPAGGHLLTWHFHKDSFFHDGLDRGYVDEVVFSQPPLIFDQPASHSAQPGQSTTFSVFAIGAETITYQWLFNDAPLPGATNALLSLTNVQAAQAGNYSVVLSNAFDAVTSATASLAVIAFPDALETTNLVWSSRGDALWTTQNVVTHDGVDAAESGALPFVPFVELSSILEAKTPSAGIVSFWVKTSSSYSLLFRLGAEEQFRLGGEVDWTYFSFPVPDRYPLEWLLLSTGFFPAGEERAWLDEVTFTPVFAPRIHREPAGGTFPANSPTQLAVGAIGAEPLGYHWFLDGVPFPTEGTNALLDFPHVQVNQGGSYFVIVSNAFGMATSAVATVRVYDLGGALDTTGLVWSTNGDGGWFSQTLVTHDGTDAAASPPITHNQSAVLETTLTGPGTLAFWWKVSSEKDFDLLTLYGSWYDDGNGRTLLQISGETDWVRRSVLVPQGQQLVQWRYGKDSTETAGLDRAWLDEVTFIPLEAPVVIDPPQSQTVPTGGGATFSVNAYGAEPLAYQWTLNGDPLPDATNSTLTLVDVGAAQQGDYRVVVSNEFGSATSASARLTVISLGDAVDNTSLVWSNSGYYSWRVDTGTTHDGVDAAVSGPLLGGEAVLETTVTGPGVVSFWWKVASFFDGECCEVFAFNIGANTQAQIGGGVDWEFRAFAVPAGTQTLRWYYLDYIEGIPWNDDRAWVDEVSYQPASQPLVMTAQPQRQTVLAGRDARLSATALGLPPLSFQWFGPAGAISGATNATLLVTNVQLTQGGAYRAVISNASGAITSAVATLRVLRPEVRGQFDTVGEAWDVEVAGPLAYVADGSAGLQVLDVTDPAHITRVGGLDTPGFARSVKISGSLAYVADSESGVQILDVSNPAAVTSAGAFDTKGLAYALHVEGSRVYVADGPLGLQVLDASNPARVTRAGGFRTESDAYDVQVVGSLAFVATHGGLRILDVTDLANITQVGSFPAGYAQAVEVLGSRAYLAETDPGDHEFVAFHELDLGVPARPIRTGGFVNPFGGGDFAHLSVIGGLAYVTSQYPGVDILDVSEPARITWAGRFGFGGYANGIRNVGNLLYIAGDFSGLSILEIAANPPTPPVFADARRRAGAFEARLTGLPLPTTIVIESSDDLATWTPLQTNSVTSEPFLFTQPIKAGDAARFFRAIVR